MRKWREEVWSVCPPKPKPKPEPASAPKKKQWKQSTCSLCNEVLKGHGTHFRGQRYCPNLPGQVPLKERLTLASCLTAWGLRSTKVFMCYTTGYLVELSKSFYYVIIFFVVTEEAEHQLYFITLNIIDARCTTCALSENAH